MSPQVTKGTAQYEVPEGRRSQPLLKKETPSPPNTRKNKLMEDDKPCHYLQFLRHPTCAAA
nr:MAG TPA: hypothetical protein [Caudoviricetes sp.]